MTVRYVFDTNVLSAFAGYYPAVFGSFWKAIDGLIEDGRFFSVREVKREVERNFPEAHITAWVKRHGDLFRIPSLEEQRLVKSIFKTSAGRELVREGKILKGMPVADPFIIASGKINGAHVITMEKRKPTGGKIPTICDSLGVTCLNVEQFLKAEKIKM